MTRTMLRTTFLPLAVALLVTGSAAVHAQDVPVLIRAARVLPLSGPALTPGAILVKDGRIEKIAGSLEAPAGARVHDLGDRVVVPGFVDAACHVGVSRERDETTTAVQPDLDISVSLDPLHPDIARWREAGITTLHLLPGDRDVVAGVGVVVKIDPAGKVRTLAERSGMKLSLRREGLEKNRAPTSALGALEMALDDDLRPQLNGLRGFVAVDTPQETRLASRLAESGLKDVVLIGGPEMRRGVHHLEGWCGGVIFRALVPGAPIYAKEVPAMVSAAGLAVAFATEGPTRKVNAPRRSRSRSRRRRLPPGMQIGPPQASMAAPTAVRRPPSMLRLSASLAAAAGMDHVQARRGLSANAAELLGVADRVGTLEAGKDADLVVLDRDPLDLRARVMMVMQDGRIVHERKDK